MYEQVEKTPEKKSHMAAKGVSQRHNSHAPTPRFVDNRSEAIQMRKLRDLAKNSPQNAKLRELHHLAAAHSVAQKKSNVKQGLGFVDNRPENNALAQLKTAINGYSKVTQLRDILHSDKYTQNFKRRHVRNGAVDEDTADARLNNSPPPPGSTVIDETTCPKSAWKTAETSNKITDLFDLPAQGWTAYIKDDGRHAAKAVSAVKVQKDKYAIINHLEAYTAVGDERIRQADGSWANVKKKKKEN